MTRMLTMLVLACLAVIPSCSREPAPTPSAEADAAAPSGREGRIYVTNEISGDLSVIDVESRRVTATIPLGKRPRGVRVSPDNRTLYVALSGSPIAGPGVDESKLSPPDRKA